MSRLRTRATRSRLRTGLLAVLGAFGLIQLVPYGRDHSNPPVTEAVAFAGPRTEQLATEACGACHSNLTSWPIESNVAPASWLIQHDVADGRARLDFSEWDRAQPALSEVVAQIQDSGMPPLQYKLLHPAARLSDSERADLIAGLTRTYGQDPPGNG